MGWQQQSGTALVGQLSCRADTAPPGRHMWHAAVGPAEAPLLPRLRPRLARSCASAQLCGGTARRSTPRSRVRLLLACSIFCCPALAAAAVCRRPPSRLRCSGLAAAPATFWAPTAAHWVASRNTRSCACWVPAGKKAYPASLVGSKAVEIAAGGQSDEIVRLYLD